MCFPKYDYPPDILVTPVRYSPPAHDAGWRLLVVAYPRRWRDARLKSIDWICIFIVIVSSKHDSITFSPAR